MSEQNPPSAPNSPDKAERELVEALRQAAWRFQNEENGRFPGSITACTAVARFIHQRGGAAELAGPFLQIAEAFRVLERGGKPRLFSKKTEPVKERERSPERKHMQRMAAVALEITRRLGDDLKVSGDRIARQVKHWPGMNAQEVTGTTIRAWRKPLISGKDPQFLSIVEQVLAQPEPRSAVEELLKKGPPGQFR
jgi:hypothetical protein